MFKLSQSTAYYWPVEVQLPTDGGQFTTETFDAQFRRVSQTELEGIAAKVAADEITDAQIVKSVLVGWRGITNHEGADLPFSQTALEQVLAITGVAKAIVLAFVDSCKGGQKRKN